MKSRGLMDFYLPPKLAFHIKVVLASVLITMFYSLLWLGTPIGSNFRTMLVLVFIQLEIFLWLASKIFHYRRNKISREYKKTAIIRLISFYLLVMIIALLHLFLTIAGGTYLSNGNFIGVVDQFLSMELGPFLISLAIGIGVGSVIFFYMEWAASLKREQKLREEKLIFQYETLKNQVNPHFLFNSLNTLSSLVSRDAELSERFISKFSSIYRYILENKDKEWVKLSEEIDFISQYFYLQKIRDNGKIDLQIDVENTEEYQILPISLQLLVENALKHNAASVENPLKIRVFMENQESLVVENNTRKKMHLESSSKVGLKNLGERISLVMKKDLVIEETPGKFVVKVPVLKNSK